MTSSKASSHEGIRRSSRSTFRMWLGAALAILFLAVGATRSQGMLRMIQMPTYSSVSQQTQMQTQIPLQLCLHERGHDGWWVQDWDYASTAQYGNMPVTNKSEVFRAHRNFVPTEEQPYRWATSWRWVDETCPVQLVALEGFCRVCNDLNISLVYVLGDSLQAAASFLYLPPRALGLSPQGWKFTFALGTFDSAMSRPLLGCVACSYKMDCR